MHPDPDGARRRLRARQRRGGRSRRRPRRRWGWWLLAMIVSVPLASVVPVAALRWIDPPITAFVLAAYVEGAREGWRVEPLAWVPATALGANAALAVIAAEDQKFPHHHGFDLAAVEQALSTRRQGGRLRGASTVSQQLAKNLFLWSGRSWLRKGVEAWFTVLLEALLTKRRILEIYLNVVEFGRGVYGVGPAAARWFGVAPRALSPSQAALLAAVLPAPKRWRVAAPPVAVRARQQWIVEQMGRLGGARYLELIGWPH